MSEEINREESRRRVASLHVADRFRAMFGERVEPRAESSGKPVLDPCCGGRMWWFDKENPLAIFADRRNEVLMVTDRSHGKADGQRVLRIEPDVVMDFRALEFADESFHLVAFDPPHLVRAGKKSWLAAKYGKLGSEWRDDLRAGFVECFRVLKPHGVLVFKWNETQVKVREVVELSPVPPLFGNTSGRKAGTHWIVFMKPGQRAAMKLLEQALRVGVSDGSDGVKQEGGEA